MLANTMLPNCLYCIGKLDYCQPSTKVLLFKVASLAQQLQSCA